MSNNPFNKVNLFIALQYLLNRKKQSILATFGVVLGVAIFIVMISFMTGVNAFLDDAVFNGSPDIIISNKHGANKEKSIFQNSIPHLDEIDKINSLLDENSNVAAYAHQTISPAILISNTAQLPVSVNGVFPDQETKMVDLDRRLVLGEGLPSLNRDNAILLGVNLAQKLELAVGDSLKMILPNGRSRMLEVSGIFSFGLTTIDHLRTYVAGKTLQHLLADKPVISHVHIKLKDRENISLRGLLDEALENVAINDWKENNKTIVVSNKVRNVLTWTISIALLLVAGFGIYNILNITVVQKRKDIAVLKTMGYTSKDIIFVFLTQSLLIGAIGAFLGVIFGFLISFAISKTPLETTDFIIVDTYPVNFNYLFYLLGLSFGIITAVLAGYFPAKKASEVDPATIIRNT
ncbi:ABC transporter permease [Spongiimicrobium sp. 3-5]|uniref:ABC transporter permease n=1 Tax=Spongiimicrobium sp. 3-5 TaxID=3332596 RepID=UPI0039817A71